MALCWSLDKVGPICRTVEDTAIVLSAIDGFDADDPGAARYGFAYDGGVDANVAAAGDRLFNWLRALEARYGVSVAAADIARSADGENVQAQLTLVRRTAP